MIHPSIHPYKRRFCSPHSAPSLSDTCSALCNSHHTLCQQSSKSCSHFKPAKTAILLAIRPRANYLSPSFALSARKKKKKKKKKMETGRGNRNVIIGKSSHPFTPSQWQELEEQAVIFNCMSLGLPIPTHLLLSLGRNRYSQPKMGFFPSYPSLGWSCFQLGSSGRAEDPEPGRCRRTDGKKWRCSRVACPDSKYCERHLHRGRNRLKKHTETTLQHESSAASVLPCSTLSLLPPINCKEPRYFHGANQTSSSGTSGLIFKHCFVLGTDLRLERPVQSEKGENQKPISLHCFFDEKQEKVEQDERAQDSQCKSLRRAEDLTSSGSGIPKPSHILLDLNV